VRSTAGGSSGQQWWVSPHACVLWALNSQPHVFAIVVRLLINEQRGSIFSAASARFTANALLTGAVACFCE